MYSIVVYNTMACVSYALIGVTKFMCSRRKSCFANGKIKQKTVRARKPIIFMVESRLINCLKFINSFVFDVFLAKSTYKNNFCKKKKTLFYQNNTEENIRMSLGDDVLL